MQQTVLIVDDHPAFRRSARLLLEAEGFDVVGEAADGASAIEAAARLVPAVVLLDVQLPDIDGFDVAARLVEAFGGNGHTPAIVMTSSRDGADFGSLVARSGARGFVPKGDLSGDRIRELLA
jgi:DNA-binding NarL/FixJ family response regulator